MNECNSGQSTNQCLCLVLVETVEVGRLIPHERVQQRAVEQSEDAPQPPVVVVEAMTLVPREQAQQRTSLSDQEKQLLHSLRNMCWERAM